MKQTPLVILGGRSLVAPHLMRQLTEAGLSADVISRRPLDLPPGFRSLALDLAQVRLWMPPENAIVISLAPIWVLARNLPRLMGVQSIIAVSSTSRFGKADSADPKERLIAENLETAENILHSWCQQSNTNYTILRPTMIYDGVLDSNVTRIARIIQRIRTFPVASPGSGLRQPIHADDVAAAIMGALGNAAVYNKALNIAGADIITYRQMVERIFESLGRKPRPLMLPTGKLEAMFKFGVKLGFLKEKFGFPVFRRMNEDLVFPCEEGLKLLRDFKPRGFKPSFTPSEK